MLILNYAYLLSIFLSPNIYYFLTGNNERFIGMSEFLLVALVFMNFLVFIKEKKSLFPVLHKDKNIKRIFILPLLILLWGVAGIPFTPIIDGQTISFLIKYLLVIILFIQTSYISTIYMKSGKAYMTLNKIMLFISASIILVSLLEIVAPGVVHTIYAYNFENKESVWLAENRLTGTAGTPNTYAILVYCVSAFLLAKAFGRKFFDVHSFMIGFMVLITFVIIALTGSRSALIAFVGQLGVFSFLSLKGRIKGYLPVMFFMIIFQSAIFIVFFYSADIMNTLFQIGTSDSYYQIVIQRMLGSSAIIQFVPPALLERLFFWYQGLSAYIHLPFYKYFLGIGLNNSEVIISRFTDLELGSVHNSYIQYLLSTGAVGLIMFLTLLKTVFQSLKNHQETHNGLFLYLFFFGLIIHSFFESNFLWNFKSMQMFFYFYGLFIAEKSLKSDLWRPA
jgi:O-antigen ligase